MKKIASIREFKQTYENWPRVLYNLFRNKSPISVHIKNDNFLELPIELVSFLKELRKQQPDSFQNGQFNFEASTGIFTFKYSGQFVNIQFYKNNELNGEFSSFLGDYVFLEPLESNIVIDIGANIADSSIWFALKGASYVIALEPYKYNYEMAMENLKINNLTEKIKMIEGGYGTDNEIEVDTGSHGIGAVLAESKGGNKIRVMSLKTILDKFVEKSNVDILLKMDCEGCEYNLLTEEADTLKMFKKIIIEYHYGYENLIAKLKECNFDVKYTEPRKWYDKDNERHLVQGYIYAKQIN